MRLGEEFLYSGDRERSPELPEGEESFHSTRGTRRGSLCSVDRDRGPSTQKAGRAALVLRRQGKDA
jgi:hypothetical protein